MQHGGREEREREIERERDTEREREREREELRYDMQRERGYVMRYSSILQVAGNCAGLGVHGRGRLACMQPA